MSNWNKARVFLERVGMPRTPWLMSFFQDDLEGKSKLEADRIRADRFFHLSDRDKKFIREKMPLLIGMNLILPFAVRNEYNHYYLEQCRQKRQYELNGPRVNVALNEEDNTIDLGEEHFLIWPGLTWEERGIFADQDPSNKKVKQVFINLFPRKSIVGEIARRIDDLQDCDQYPPEVRERTANILCRLSPINHTWDEQEFFGTFLRSLQTNLSNGVALSVKYHPSFKEMERICAEVNISRKELGLDLIQYKKSKKEESVHPLDRFTDRPPMKILTSLSDGDGTPRRSK